MRRERGQQLVTVSPVPHPEEDGKKLVLLQLPHGYLAMAPEDARQVAELLAEVAQEIDGFIDTITEYRVAHSRRDDETVVESYGTVTDDPKRARNRMAANQAFDEKHFPPERRRTFTLQQRSVTRGPWKDA